MSKPKTSTADNTGANVEDNKRSIEVVKPPAATQQPPQMTVDDPMRDGAVFNQPIDDQSLAATDFPIMDASGESSAPSTGSKDVPIRNASSTSLALSRTSSESRNGSVTDNTIGQTLQKRPQRKLTKSRVNSETVNEKALSIEKTAEKPRGVLTKKDRQLKSSATPIEDGEGPENTPLVSSRDEANNIANGSASTQSSSLRDRFFPG